MLTKGKDWISHTPHTVSVQLATEQRGNKVPKRTFMWLIGRDLICFIDRTWKGNRPEHAVFPTHLFLIPLDGVTDESSQPGGK